MKKIFIHQPAYYSSILLVLLALITGGCKKEKFNNTIPVLNVSNQSGSSIRMFNFSGYPANMTVNNIPLTSYTTGSNQQGTPLGLSLFPTGVWTAGDGGSPFTMPNSLLDKDGKIHIIINGNVNGSSVTDTTIVNDVAHPLDYYLMLDGHFKVVERNNIPPSSPQSFKIRIINLGDAADKFELTSPISLTYADGSEVDPALNNVALSSTSGYAEIPYGTYQFKLFATAGGTIRTTRQLAELPTMPRVEPCAINVIQPQEGLNPRARTFKPGGVYSIVVTRNLFTYIGCDTYPATVYSNSYRIITEYDPGVNGTYARMQAVNAIPGKQITVKVDGTTLGGPLPYIGLVVSTAAQQSPYQIFVQGNHHIQATDENGTVLAEGDLKLYPYDNYTIWAYNKPDGQPAILFEANDMSGTIYKTSYQPGGPGAGVLPDDGINGSLRISRFNYALESRFLNLSPDVPYATFTNDHQLFLPQTGQSELDTVRYFGAYINLAPGVMPANNSSIIYSLPPFKGVNSDYSEFGRLPKYIRVYQSKPGNQPEIPGGLLADVAPVDVLQAFISNQVQYSTPKYKTAETGIYTVALVGKTKSSSSAEKARIVVIKHNK